MLGGWGKLWPIAKPKAWIFEKMLEYQKALDLFYIVVGARFWVVGSI